MYYMVTYMNKYIINKVCMYVIVAIRIMINE